MSSFPVNPEVPIPTFDPEVMDDEVADDEPTVDEDGERLPDATPDWNAYYTGYPTVAPQQALGQVPGSAFPVTWRINGFHCGYASKSVSTFHTSVADALMMISACKVL